MNTSKEYVKSANPIQVYNKGNIINESKKGMDQEKRKEKKIQTKRKKKNEDSYYWTMFFFCP